MVYTFIDHRNDVIKCSKLKWNHQPQACGFTAKFWTFYGVISMVYKSVEHGKLWSICFLQWHLFLVSCEVSREIKRQATFFLLFFVFLALPLQLQGPTLPEISPHMLKLGSSLTMLRSKIIFTKNQKQNNRHSLTCYAISFTLMKHSSRPISSVRGFGQLL